MTSSSNYDDLMTVNDLINLLYDKVPDRNAKVVLTVYDPDGAHHHLRCQIRTAHNDTWRMPLVEIIGEPLPGETEKIKEYIRIETAACDLLDELDGVLDDPHEDPGARDAMNEMCAALNRHEKVEEVQ